jgi:hypothetical protein
MRSEAAKVPVEGDFLDPRSRDLDERHALKMFLGKTPEQAEELFRQNFLFYQEDLTNMRTPAFRFYVLPAMKYLLSDAASGDPDAVSTFCFVIESRLKNDAEGIEPIRAVVFDAIKQIIGSFTRYDCDQEIYGDVLARYRALANRLNA